MKPAVYSLEHHPIRPERIDKDALYALRKLHRAGFTTYLVGGSVRDLLMDKTPKDVDISTAARPEEIRRLFSNCYLIGRRFRLAHLHFGRKIFQVSTFRAGETDQESLITHDNTWGSPEEDALRRDFTINGLFYDPSNNRVIDYVGGWKDLLNNTLRTIGKPVARFKQDPVRMIRALKFQARFGFLIEEETNEALDLCQDEILKSAPARLLEELLRMMESGASSPFFSLLIERKFFPLLLPALQKQLKTCKEKFLITLEAMDRFCLSEKQSIDRGVLIANFLFTFLNKQPLSQIELLLEKLVRNPISPLPRKIATGAEKVLKDYFHLIKAKRPHNTPGYEGHCLLQFLKTQAPMNEEAATLLHQLRHPTHG